MSDDWGRLTALGGSEAEALAGAAVSAVRAAIAAAIAPRSYEAVVLIGGYGRGEGGVERTASGERLHNNLDVLVVTTADAGPDLKALLDRALAPVRSALGIGVDVGTIAARSLRRAPCLVMWLDMRLGHKTLLGDAGLVPSLTRFRHDRLIAWDVDALVTNRAALLVLNRLLFARGEVDEGARRTIVKHAQKAIVGYGDGLLHALARYDGSYAEKARRVRASAEIPRGLAKLYEQAIAFRFAPDYRAFEERDLGAWHDDVLGTLRDAHFDYLSRRAGRSVAMRDVVDVVLGRALWDDDRSPRGLARRALTFARSRLPTGGLSALSALGLHSGGERALLAVTLPIVLYGEGSPAERRLAATLLGAGSGAHALERAFAKRWSCHGDANGPAALAAMGLLEAVAA